MIIEVDGWYRPVRDEIDYYEMPNAEVVGKAEVLLLIWPNGDRVFSPLHGKWLPAELPVEFLRRYKHAHHHD